MVGICTMHAHLFYDGYYYSGVDHHFPKSVSLTDSNNMHFLCIDIKILPKLGQTIFAQAAP